MKKRVLIVGAGNVGGRVIALLRRRAVLTVLTSQASRRAELRAAGAARVLVADLDRARTLAALGRMRFDAVIHMAPPQASGECDLRTRRLTAALGLTTARCRASGDRSIRATQALARAGRRILAAGDAAAPPSPHGRQGRPPVFVYVSTTGVYGDCGGARIDESCPPRPANARARRRVDAERVLAQAARAGTCRLAVLRAPGIYDAAHLPVARLRAGTPAMRAEDDSYSNHIHADDLAAMCVAALRTRRTARVYNACDWSEMKMADWFDLVADSFGLPRPPRLPREEARRAVSPMLWSFMNESRRMGPGRIVRELGFRHRWPTVHEGLAAPGRTAGAATH
ncbi:NAD-dependent epimerase/dehydratase family protein [Derxia gummosa]|uniref:NAD-dependent epimerase/dehydratase family protein n=1 Tax=Derxia gummosa DSM 723 TaxID=1121388 RepID=A0A8B6XC82_9BURK|nr:NAD-dependent epimerase/dehydratase family protein [Derxia gummosa]